MSTPTPPATPAFIAWRRVAPAGSWARISEGNEDECWSAVQAAAGQSGGDFAVLPADRDPNATRPFAGGGRRRL